MVSPQGGLGNRLRAIAGAMVLAQQTGRTCYHAWRRIVPNDSRSYVRELQILGYDVFFEDSEHLSAATADSVPVIDVCFSEWLPGDGWYAVQSDAQRDWGVVPFAMRYNNPADAVAQSRAEVVLIESSHAARLSAANRGYDTDSMWDTAISAAYAQLLPRRLYCRVSDSVPECDICFHVRRGDILEYFPESRQSIEAISSWAIEVGAGYTVCVLSDDAATRTSLAEALAKAGISVVNCHALGLGNFGTQERAFIEFLDMARRCRLITGTPASSFAFEASRFGQRPYFRNLDSPTKIRAALQMVSF